LNYLDQIKTEINRTTITPNDLNRLQEFIQEKLPISLKKQEDEYKKICKIITEDIEKNEIQDAVSLLKIIYLSKNNELGHSIVKSSGVFRSSKYNYEHQNIITTLNELKEFLKNLNIILFTSYFESVINLLKISTDLKIEENKIVEFLKDGKKLRLLLTNSDHAFFVAAVEPEFYMYANTIEDKIIKEVFYAPEVVSSSVSAILNIYIKYSILGIIPRADFNAVNDVSFDVTSILKSAFIIMKYNELEIDVGVFEYTASYKNNLLKINGNDFEKNKRIGYFLSAQKRNSLIFETYQALEKSLGEKNIFSFDNFKQIITDLHRDGTHIAYELRNNPDRFALRLPLFFFKIPHISKGSLTKEDFLTLSILSHENYLFDDDIRILFKIANTPINKNFTTLDYIKLSRIFKIMNYLLQTAYTENKDKNPNINNIFNNSLLSIYSKENLYTTIKEVLTLNNDIEVEKFLEPIILDITKNCDLIDLQYTPILKINNYEYLVLTATAFSSDLIRRISIKNKFSFSIDTSKKPAIDYMIVELESSFNQKGFLVKPDFKFSNFEIDLIALKDNNLFLFECKNPYHGVNNHELRNTYDHIKKAVFQMNRAKYELETLGKLNQFFDELGWSEHFNNQISIHYGIINANRTLVGYTEKNVTVYHAHQLLNVLNTGKIVSFGEVKSIWKNEVFEVQDLINFLNNDMKNHNINDLSEKYNINMKISNNEICIETYLCGLDVIRESYQIPENISINI
jgi:hypothetical protein